MAPRSEKRLSRDPGTGVTCGCELPGMDAGNQTGPLEEQEGLLNQSHVSSPHQCSVLRVTKLLHVPFHCIWKSYTDAVDQLPLLIEI